MRRQTREWIKKAEDDFAICTREISLKPIIADAICFHAQQCVEKYMKAILCENKLHAEKTHDLSKLLARCQPFLPMLMTLSPSLRKLSDAAVETRYPGFEATAKDAKRFLKVATRIRRLIRKYLKV